MRWLALIWKSLMRSKRRTLLIVGSLVLSVFTVAVLQSLLTTLNSVTDNPNSSNRLVVRHKSGLTQMLPRSYEAYLRQQSEVETVCALQWFGGYYQDPRNFFANFASDETTLFQIFREEFGVSGITEAQIKDYIRDGAGCIVGESLAKKNGWKVGDVVPLTGTIFPLNPRLTIRLIFKSPKPSDENALHFHYKVLEEGVPYMKGLVGSFWVRARRPEDIPRLIERVDRHYANSAYETLTETENAFNLAFVKMLGNIGAIIHHRGGDRHSHRHRQHHGHGHPGTHHRDRRVSCHGLLGRPRPRVVAGRGCASGGCGRFPRRAAGQPRGGRGSLLAGCGHAFLRGFRHPAGYGSGLHARSPGHRCAGHLHPGLRGHSTPHH